MSLDFPLRRFAFSCALSCYSSPPVTPWSGVGREGTTTHHALIVISVVHRHRCARYLVVSLPRERGERYHAEVVHAHCCGVCTRSLGKPHRLCSSVHSPPSFRRHFGCRSVSLLRFSLERSYSGQSMQVRTARKEQRGGCSPTEGGQVVILEGLEVRAF